MFWGFEGFEFLGVAWGFCGGLSGIFWGCVIASRFLKNGVAIQKSLFVVWVLGVGLGFCGGFGEFLFFMVGLGDFWWGFGVVYGLPRHFCENGSQ